MKLLQELIYTDVGLMSLVVILAILCMAVFFLTLFLRKPPADKSQAAAKPAKPLTDATRA